MRHRAQILGPGFFWVALPVPAGFSTLSPGSQVKRSQPRRCTATTHRESLRSLLPYAMEIFDYDNILLLPRK